MKNPNEPMTKAQRHVVMDKRAKEYGKPALREFIKNKYGIENVELLKLTKEQAQAIITGFKPHKKPEVIENTEENNNGN